MTDGQSEVLREMSEHTDNFADDLDDNGRVTEAIRVGPEWDFDVAKAIGLKTVVLHDSQVFISPREWDEIRGIEHETCEGDVACIPFRPSVDLNVAFVVARKEGLFTSAIPNLLVEKVEPSVDIGEGSLRVSFWRFPDACRSKLPSNASEAVAGGEGATLCLAICAAILKLKEKE